MELTVTKAGRGWQRRVIIALVLLVPLLAWGAYAVVLGDAAMDFVDEIEVIITDFTYIPGLINLREGQSVRMIITNEGKLPHDYVIVGLGEEIATKILQPGETEVLEFTPQITGRLEVFCTLPGHQEIGLITGGSVR